MYATIEKRTALLVDDEVLSRKAQQSRLEGEGYTVFVAADRAEALSRARQIHPNVIFVHLVSGSTGNLPLIQALRAEDACRHIPIMVLRDGGDSRVARTKLKSVPRDAW
jgi:CheY-like chemotaxis protein